MTVNDWTFLSRNNNDEYINLLASSIKVNTVQYQDFVYEKDTNPLVIRGMTKAKKILRKALKDNRTTYYVDTGYMGNHSRPENPKGFKHYHRIVKNGLQHSEIIDRPDDRLKQCPVKFEKWKKPGSKILLVTPSDKPCKFYGINRDNWVNDTINLIKKYTDREIIVRDKNPVRHDRVRFNSIYEALDDDVWALVTYQSVAATEAVLYGYPAFCLAPNAADPVTYNDLSKIENPFIPDNDLRYKWACHLSYGQFHVNEMENGTAISILKNDW